MGKICKFANIYDKNGKIIRKVDKNGELPKYTIEELEQLIDQLAADYERDKGAVTKYALDYANSMLMDMYRKQGNPHEKEIIEKLKAQYGENKTTGELVQSALRDLADNTPKDEEEHCSGVTVMDEYVEPIEEITHDEIEQQGDTEPSSTGTDES